MTALEDQEGALLEAIGRAPEDEVLRLVYADWLAEHGEAHLAELVVQCELARPGPPGDARRRRLAQSQAELLPSARKRWLSRLGLGGVVCEIHLGLPARVEVGIGELLEAPLAPIGGFFLPQVTLRASPRTPMPALADQLERVAECANLSLLQRLDLSGMGAHRPTDALIGAVVDAFARSPRLERLRGLALRVCNIGSRGAAALAASPWMGRLEEIDLADNEMETGGAVALAGSPHAANLRRLDVSVNRIGAQGLAALHRAFGPRVKAERQRPPHS